MRVSSVLALAILAAPLGGCAYLAVPPDPIRYVTSPGDVTACHRLGPVGLARTDGTGPVLFSDRTKAVRVDGIVPSGEGYPAATTREIPGPNFAVRVETMRDGALALGATDLLLSRRIYHDWSYVEGIAYRCRN